MAGIGWKWLEIAVKSGNGWKSWEIPGNGWKGLDMARCGLQFLEMAGNGWKWL